MCCMVDTIPIECTAGASPVMMQKIIRVESSGNPFAIGVVGGRLARQPRTLEEALATTAELEKQGFNYSIGISQVNRQHFERLGWKKQISEGFDPCANLRAGAAIFKNCYSGALRAGYVAEKATSEYSATHASLSCYYSGKYEASVSTGYVTKVLGTGTAVVPRKVPFGKKTAPSMFD